MTHGYFGFENAQERAKANPDTFEAPDLEMLRFIVQEGMHVKVCGGCNHFERFWVRVTKREGNNLFGRVDNHLFMADGIGVPEFGDVVSFKLEHIYQYPIIVPPKGTRISEVQIVGMSEDEDEDAMVASASYIPKKEPTCYDVLVRYCDEKDPPEEPETVDIEDWSFDTWGEANVFANYLAETYTPGYVPEYV